MAAVAAPTAAPPGRSGWDDDPIPISALQHALYCLRQCALIHLDRAWAENRLTAEGRVLHEAADTTATRRRHGVRTATALPIACRRLGIAGIADVVEFHADERGETPFPVEYKRGRPKLHRADEVQLCAQALCLEEMSGVPVPKGALFYGETRRRLAIHFNTELRRLTEETISTVRALLGAGTLPTAVYEPRKCRACSLIDICRPKVAGRSASVWRERAVAAALDDGFVADGAA
jgi:CRISPR-associated exonuclease Cas4